MVDRVDLLGLHAALGASVDQAETSGLTFEEPASWEPRHPPLVKALGEHNAYILIRQFVDWLMKRRRIAEALKAILSDEKKRRGP